MKKSLFALAALGAFATAAQAQSSVTLYGILDVGLVSQTNSADLNPQYITSGNGQGNGGNTQQRPGTANGMISSGQSISRWGLKGTEDLGGGNSAFFNLESSLNATSGNTGNTGIGSSGYNTSGSHSTTATYGSIGDTANNGQLFSRASNVGIKNATLGSLAFGRVTSFGVDVIPAYDPVNANYFSPINFSGGYGGGGLTDNTRVDGGIKYTNKIDNVNVGLLYKLGGVAGNNSSKSALQANLGYETSSFGLQAVYQSYKDATSLDAANTILGTGNALLGGNVNSLNGAVDATYYDTVSYMLTGKVKVVESVSLFAGWENYIKKAASNGTADLTTSQVNGINVYNATAYTGSDINYNMYWVGANYQAAPAVKLSAGYYQLNQDSYTSSTLASPGAASKTQGTSQYYSLMAEYMLSKRTNLYAAYVHTDLKDNAVVTSPSTGTFNSFDTYGVGVRHMF
jgi:predicted porin